jgi:membrane protease YdiL (CAAX protease family)
MKILLQQIQQTGHDYQLSAIAVCLLIVAFAVYHYLSVWSRYKFTQQNHNRERADFISYITQRLIGFISYGFIPFIVLYHMLNINTAYYGLNLQNFETSLLWISIITPVILFFNYSISGRQSNLRNYPQIRLRYWDNRSLTLNFLTWMLYLLAYEMMFRGFLLFAFYKAFGSITAVTVNVILYALVHIPKGNKEILGSIPFGIILCWITLDTGSFVAAFVLHGIMAVSNELFSIRAHPEMSIKK